LNTRTKKKYRKDFLGAFFPEALKIVRNQNLFLFDDTYWLQLDGMAMGTPSACLHVLNQFGKARLHGCKKHRWQICFFTLFNASAMAFLSFLNSPANQFARG